MTALVKSARKQDSQHGASFDLLNLSEILYYEGENFIYPSQSELIENWENLKKGDERIQSCLRGAKLINKFLQKGQEETGVYRLFKQTLSAMNVEEQVNWRSVEIGFYLKLIKLAGIKPALLNCSLCGSSVDVGEKVGFSPSSGGVVCDNCNKPDDSFAISPRLRKSLNILGDLPQEMADRLALSRKDYLESLKILDRLAEYHLEIKK